MAKKYKITYLPLFYKDLDSITDYIKYNLNNEIAANNLVDEIENQLNKRLESPESYEGYILGDKRKKIYYRIYVKNYIIFYIVKDNVMEIRRILYAKRNFDKLI